MMVKYSCEFQLRKLALVLRSLFSNMASSVFSIGYTSSASTNGGSASSAFSFGNPPAAPLNLSFNTPASTLPGATNTKTITNIQRPILQPPRDSSTLLRNLFSNAQFSDVQISFKFSEYNDEVKTYQLHSFVLCGRSPYFETMFNSKFKESSETDITVVIERGSPKTFEIFLKYLYYHEAGLQSFLMGTPKLNLNEVEDILRYGKFFLVPTYDNLFNECEAILAKNHVNGATLPTLYPWIAEYNLFSLRIAIRNFMSQILKLDQPFDESKIPTSLRQVTSAEDLLGLISLFLWYSKPRPSDLPVLVGGASVFIVELLEGADSPKDVANFLTSLDSLKIPTPISLTIALNAFLSKKLLHLSDGIEEERRKRPSYSSDNSSRFWKRDRPATNNQKFTWGVNR
ncbi:hypothetical protein BKA69DRAFT_507525 [Paraphysoderma sedebokerense]|nr:hypothetical protein BKA69DRAFT_507525 [Paraphysoderma sedebokerense]